ncbi:MAG TPA: ferritin-like domain-containing protein [Candidatus Avalokitesvara rifleensis]|uniref:ferritin-like domain-containing protein n=1 Tax=Candidatus Avalokitesvara rifleensis TaxID=3367620 RepID=UPI002713D1B2|nr:ferritin-like domain-containing protein [Candidatus Brocadiales bacterium]
MNNKKIVEILNKALTEEITALLQYIQHHYLYKGANAQSVKELFKKLSFTEMDHAYKLGERIAALGGMPTTKPNAPKVPKKSIEMINVDLQDERDAVVAYREWIKVVDKEGDVTSRNILEGILADEEGHIAELESLLGD